MKKAILFITAVIISSALTFGTSSAEETFSGTAEGHNGSVSVAVKIGDGGVLKQAEVTSHIETKGISDRQSQKFRSAFWRLNRCKLT